MLRHLRVTTYIFLHGLIEGAARPRWLVLALIFSFVLSAHGATVTWTGGGGNGNWSTGANWGGSAPSANDNLVFAGSTRLSSTNDLPADRSFNSIVFSSGAGAFTLSGNRITLAGNITNSSSVLQTIAFDMILSATPTVNCASGDCALSGILSGAGGLTKSGTGTITLSQVETFTGVVTVSAGNLAVATTGNPAQGTLGAASGIVINSGGTLTATGGSNSLIGYTSSGVKTIQVNAGGTLTANGGNTYHLNAVVLNGGTISASTTEPTYGTWNFDFGITTAGGGTSSTISGGNAALTQSGGTTFTISAGDTVTVSTILAHTPNASDTGLVKAGAGTLVLSGTNTYTSATSVTAGVLSVTNAAGLGNSSGTTVSSGACLDINGVAVGTEALTITGTGIAASGAVTGSGTASCAGTVTLAGNTTIRGSGFLTLSGMVSGAFALAKSGSGTLTLAGTNTYTGATTISGGTLAVTGSTASGSAVTVASGGTLGGTGTISGTIAVASGGTLAPGTAGTAIATLTTGAVTPVTGAAFAIDLDGGGPNSDRVSTVGTMTCAGTLTVNSASNASIGKVYTIISAGTVTGTFTGLVNGAMFNAQSRTFQIAYSGTTVTLTDVARPTTRVWDGGGGDNNWSTAANWDFDLAPSASDALQFAGATRTSPNNDYTAATSFASITFNSGASVFTVGGNAIALTSGMANSSANAQTLNLAMAIASTCTADTTGGSLTIGGVLSGAGGLTVTGSNTLTLSGANTWNGNTTVSAGTLKNGAAGVIPDSSAVTVASGATWNLNNFNETVGSLAGAGGVSMGTGNLTVGGDNTSTTYSGVSSGSGLITKTGTGTYTLAGTSTMTGKYVVSGGLISLPTTSFLGALPGAYTADYITLSGGGLLFTTTTTGNALRGIPLAGGGGSISASAGLTFTPLMVVTGTGTLTTGSGGTGTVALSGANNFTGAVAISAGTLQNAGANVIPDGSAVTVASGAVYDLNIFSDTIGSLAGAGNTSLGSATLTLGGNNNSTTYSGVTSGTGNLVKNRTGTYTLSGTSTSTGVWTINAGTVSVTQSANFGAVPGSFTAAYTTLNGGGILYTATNSPSAHG